MKNGKWHTTKDEAGNHGLGIGIVTGIVKNAGGDFTLGYENGIVTAVVGIGKK